ncbi:MFS transporter [Salininema proteolyticum]|uniref:MFS transporter n=1 Tax=Salininema proteolyticum TaxID=1607685 RepID=A0ABV8U4E2_9ACTN
MALVATLVRTVLGAVEGWGDSRRGVRGGERVIGTANEAELEEQVTTASSAESGFRSLLRDKGFPSYFGGVAVSSLGNAMSEVAVVLVAMTLVDVELSGQAVAASTIAYMLPGLMVGILLSRYVRKFRPTTLIMADCLWRFGWFAIIGLLYSRDKLTLAIFVACLAAAALSKSAGRSGANATVPLLVPRDRLLHANTLSGIVVQGSTMVGPALAGLIASLWSPVGALVLDGATFLVFAVGAFAASRVIREKGGDEITGGAAETQRSGPWRLVGTAMPVFVTTGVFYLLYGCFVVALPLLAAGHAPEDGGAGLLGVMWSLFGAGAVVSGLLAPRLRFLVRPRSLAAMSGGWGLCMCAVAASPHPALAALSMFLGGLAYGPYGAVVRTLFQRDFSKGDNMEVSGYYGALTSAAAPLGIMAAGILSSFAGPGAIMGAAGAVLVAMGTVGTAVMWRMSGLAAPEPCER